MNNQIQPNFSPIQTIEAEEAQERSPFILGNTQPVDFNSLQENYLVPVFSRDNCETISHNEFISTVCDAVQTHFQGEQFLEPQIYVSHEMRLRYRAGAGKLVENLNESDSGSYFQRMMFMIEIPSISYEVAGCKLSLQICGVRSYHETNLLGNSSQKQLFRLGCGFLNHLCTNTLLETSGVKLDIKVTNTADLFKYAMELFARYQYGQHIENLRRLHDTTFSVHQIAQFLGKARMYSALPASIRNEMNLPEFILPEA